MGTRGTTLHSVDTNLERSIGSGVIGGIGGTSLFPWLGRTIAQISPSLNSSLATEQSTGFALAGFPLAVTYCVHHLMIARLHSVSSETPILKNTIVILADVSTFFVSTAGMGVVTATSFGTALAWAASGVIAFAVMRLALSVFTPSEPPKELIQAMDQRIENAFNDRNIPDQIQQSLEAFTTEIKQETGLSIPEMVNRMNVIHRNLNQLMQTPVVTEDMLYKFFALKAETEDRIKKLEEGYNFLASKSIEAQSEMIGSQLGELKSAVQVIKNGFNTENNENDPIPPPKDASKRRSLSEGNGNNSSKGNLSEEQNSTNKSPQKGVSLFSSILGAFGRKSYNDLTQLQSQSTDTATTHHEAEKTEKTDKKDKKEKHTRRKSIDLTTPSSTQSTPNELTTPKELKAAHEQNDVISSSSMSFEILDPSSTPTSPVLSPSFKRSVSAALKTMDQQTSVINF